jgi:hypothetical protein
MNSKNLIRKLIALCLTVTVLSVYSMVVLATPGQDTPTGELTASGQVTVNGQSAITGATIFSDSTITTSADSTAVVSVGKLQKIELLPNTTLKISFNESGMNGELSAGKVAVTTMSGKTASITTKDGVVMGDTNQTDIFFVDVQCGNTRVETQSGLAVLRAGGNDQQVAAGKSAAAGQQTAQSRCTPAAPTDTKFPTWTGGTLALLLLLIGGATTSAIIVGTKKDNTTNTGGGVIIVSPIR